MKIVWLACIAALVAGCSTPKSTVPATPIRSMNLVEPLGEPEQLPLFLGITRKSATNVTLWTTNTIPNAEYVLRVASVVPPRHDDLIPIVLFSGTNGGSVTPIDRPIGPVQQRFFDVRTASVQEKLDVMQFVTRWNPTRIPAPVDPVRWITLDELRAIIKTAREKRK